MARNKSFIKLDGTLDGLTFYRQNGESLVKTKSQVSKNRIMRDPAYKRTRENMMEFGGAARAGKAFRDGFANMVKLMGDSYLSARVSGLMKRINSTGAGKRGERDIDVVAMRDMFRGFEFNKQLPFKSVFYAPYTLPEIDPARDLAKWKVLDFNTDAFITAPEGATHFKLVLAAGYVSNYSYEAATNTYEPVDETVNGLGGTDTSAAIPIGGMVGGDTTLTVDLTALGAIPVTSALFVSIGIVFYQEINTDLYEFAQSNTMKVAVTG
ncbi:MULTISPECIES: hypothetical protein [Bizionia]|uniref:Uncharacterized protein n=1 Tax=Bizionia algoritergicola TaxID=291187 RepID=A0A5D0QWL5_9FLAO|nr:MULTISPECIES: hypothetical protein [Bizionia]OBX24069.1 hypothetical protein BAA08_01650 [Bizionia sp. APA-3]TYB73580.1 hypothetical protein ES675_07955 [Bizionia algoritergicola]